MKIKDSKKYFYISLFGGLFGIDKFYEGNFKLGLLKLFTVGGYGIWWIIDIILAYKQVENKSDIKLNKIDKKYINGFKTIFKILLVGFISFILFGIILAVLDPNDEIINNKNNNSNNLVIEEQEQKQEKLSIDIKKQIYYIYNQTEHIASLKTIEKFGDGGIQEERDNFFKNTKLEYEKQLTAEKGIDFEIYSKNAISISGEGNNENWDKPTSESDDVLIYVYGENKFTLIKATNDFLNKKANMQNLQTQCSMLIQGDGFLSSFNRATIQKINDTQIDVITDFNGKNAFGKKVKQQVICKYKYNEDYKKYEIYDIQL